MSARRVGVIGGVGPLAAAHFLIRLIQLTPAERDEDHLPAVLAAEPVPSRIAHLLGRGPSPLPALLTSARSLVAAGADLIVIPSATTHGYHAQIAAEVPVPVLDLLAETAAALDTRGCRRPLLLATEATSTLRLFERRLPDRLLPRYPEHAQQQRVSALIDSVKRGAPVEHLRADLTELLRSASWPADVDCVLLACTELSVITPRTNPLRIPVLDVADILATAAIRAATGELPEGVR